jgi:DNA-binding PadR family transcriptional regulator
MRHSDPTLLVLASLADGPKHGYAITRDVLAMSDVRLGPGTLYGALARLERRGMIEPLASEDRRRPYRLTASGAQELREQLHALERVTRVGLARLASTGHAL